ncbi:WD40-repeat-containing domain protein [Suillus subluteus]|nr:WD40-repeat-containing domain protein [Suillus subluteus]
MASQHSGTIAALSFSSCGTYLASAGIDGKLVIWFVKTGIALHVIRGDAGMLSIAWVTPSQSKNLLCGAADGTVISIKFNSDLSATGYKAHRFPVKHLAIEHSRVATGAFHQVFLWDNNGDQWCREASYDAPLSDGANAKSEVIITGLHWMQTKECQFTLAVSYLHHGIVFWNALTHTRIQCLPVPSFVASTTISPDHHLLAVSNLMHGFDIYNLETYAIEGRVFNEISTGHVVPVLFIHHGCAVIGGSATGTVRMWDVDSTNFMHALEHGGSAYLCIDPIQDQFLIATGVEGCNTTYIQLWEAEDICMAAVSHTHKS